MHGEKCLVSEKGCLIAKETDANYKSFFFHFIQRIRMEDHSQKLWASDTGIIVVHNCWKTKWKWRVAMFQKMSKKKRISVFCHCEGVSQSILKPKQYTRHSVVGFSATITTRPETRHLSNVIPKHI